MTNESTMPQKLLQKLRAGERFLITSHVNPDGDAVGSSLGLARILRRVGKSATVWLRDTPPEAYSRLPGCGRIHVGTEPPAGFPEDFAHVITLECPSFDRCGLDDELSALPVLNIDHHLGNEHYGAVNWVDASAPAVGEMVVRLAEQLHADIDASTATCLFLALATDTGWFRFGSASPLAFRVAADLCERGAQPEEISEWLYEQQPVAAVQLLTEMLPTLEIAENGSVATVVLTQEMFERAGAEQQHTEGLIDYPRSIDGVQAVALIRQLDSGGYKVSLRSRGDRDVQRIALQYGGGGHKNAAGFASDLALDELRAKVVAELGKVTAEKAAAAED